MMAIFKMFFFFVDIIHNIDEKIWSVREGPISSRKGSPSTPMPIRCPEGDYIGIQQTRPSSVGPLSPPSCRLEVSNAQDTVN